MAVVLICSCSDVGNILNFMVSCVCVFLRTSARWINICNGRYRSMYKTVSIRTFLYFSFRINSYYCEKNISETENNNNRNRKISVIKFWPVLVAIIPVIFITDRDKTAAKLPTEIICAEYPPGFLNRRFCYQYFCFLHWRTLKEFWESKPVNC